MDKEAIKKALMPKGYVEYEFDGKVYTVPKEIASLVSGVLKLSVDNPTAANKVMDILGSTL
jgi:hypothetical protein